MSWITVPSDQFRSSPKRWGAQALGIPHSNMALELEPTVGCGPGLKRSPGYWAEQEWQAWELGRRGPATMVGAGWRGRCVHVEKGSQGLWILLHVGLFPKLHQVLVQTPPTGPPISGKFRGHVCVSLTSGRSIHAKNQGYK